MPLCHWPCSCYPNHALGQIGDWMNEIYQRWAAAHGVMIVTPVHWYQAPSALKLMIDRLVCADGGNPDPTSTGGKDPKKAKALELAGWAYPKHLAGRVYGLVVHGDVGGVEGTRRALADWLDGMGLVDAGRRRASTATSATTSPTPPATTRSTATRPCRKRCETSRAPWRTPWASCARSASRFPTRARAAAAEVTARR